MGSGKIQSIIGIKMGLMFIFASLILLLSVFDITQARTTKAPPSTVQLKSLKNERPRSLLSTSSSSRSKISKPKSLSILANKSNINSTRNTRQTPAIPALYSAPKVQPDIPALYSAPKVQPEIPALYSAPDPDSQNELDSPEQTMHTTEISVGEEDEELEDDFMEDTSEAPYQQYGVPQSRNLNDQEEPQTESNPSATSRSNDVEPELDDTTEDSYNSSFDDEDEAKEPSSQYGPPQTNGQGKSNKANAMERPGSSKQQNKSKNEQPSPEQGTEMPQDFYLPPVYYPQQTGQEQSNKGEIDSMPYQDNSLQYQQPPNSNYRTLPLMDHTMQQGNDASSPYGSHQDQQDSPGYSSQPEKSGSQNMPSSVYGPPPVNQLNSVHTDEDERLEGLDEKIVDAELLNTVQKIIEDHEMQQKKSNGRVPSTQYGPPPSSNNPGGDFSNGYQNSHGNSQSVQPPSSSPYHTPQNDFVAGNHKRPSFQNEEASNENEKHAPVEVEYQKAILSKHFVETQPDTMYNSFGRDNQNSLYHEEGTSAEYLPPSVPSTQRKPEQRELEKNIQPSVFGNAYMPERSQNEDGYGVKLRTGIVVGGSNGETMSYSQPSLNYGPPATTSPMSFQMKIFQAPQTSPYNSYLPPTQHQQPVPSTVYGVPLAPVISLDANNNLQVHNTGQSQNQEDPDGRYLPPPQHLTGESFKPTAISSLQGIGDALSLPNHEYGSSISNFHPQDDTELLNIGSGTSPIILKLAQYQQGQYPYLDNNMGFISSSENFPAFLYDPSGSYRVSRRALSREASVVSTSFKQ